MTRLNLVLLLAVLASALYLVRTQYESRRLYVELKKASAQARRIEQDNELLQVEKRAQGTPLRVEKLAKDSLQMRTATPSITQYVTYKDAADINTGSGVSPAPAAPVARAVASASAVKSQAASATHSSASPSVSGAIKVTP